MNSSPHAIGHGADFALDATVDLQSDGVCFSLTLGAVPWLFSAPPCDPLRGAFERCSGVQLVEHALAPQCANSGVTQLKVVLPAAACTPQVQAQIRAALDGYCAERIAAIERDLAGLRYALSTAMRLGLIFLAACLLLSGWAGQSAWLPSFVRRFASEGLVIAGWVGLWRPLELLLFERGPYMRQIQLYTQLRSLKLQLVPASGPVPEDHGVRDEIKNNS